MAAYVEIVFDNSDGTTAVTQQLISYDFTCITYYTL